MIGLGWNASGTDCCCLAASDFRLCNALGVTLSGCATLFRFLLSDFADPPLAVLGAFELVGVSCTLDVDFRFGAFVAEVAVARAAVDGVTSFVAAGFFLCIVGFAN